MLVSSFAESSSECHGRSCLLWSKDMLQTGEGISHAPDPKAAADFTGVCITGLDMFVIVL